MKDTRLIFNRFPYDKWVQCTRVRVALDFTPPVGVPSNLQRDYDRWWPLVSAAIEQAHAIFENVSGKDKPQHVFTFRLRGASTSQYRIYAPRWADLYAEEGALMYIYTCWVHDEMPEPINEPAI